MTPLLDIRTLTRVYGGRTPFGSEPAFVALDDVSFSVSAGSIHGLVGESGSGKSTLARLVMALDRPTSGDVLLEGQSIFSLSAKVLKHRRRDFQMVFQDPLASLDPRYTVGRIVAEPLHVLEPKPRRDEARQKVVDILGQVGLSADAIDRFPHEFSGGQRQRIAFARALITRPKLVVADEPVSALDLSVQAQVLNLIQDMRKEFGTAFLFISHDLAVVEAIADQVTVMRRGRIVETGTVDDIFDRPQQAYTRELLAAQLSLT
ncbi:ATP-binding cassette domain-containing protein [Rhizobium sp. LjRoot30]|uniref:ATP-binding cassette domain-containing protein n=1 Tax=Rhizobium sp. LjRoot30 TaxID=3342320 RepID=UPI003ECC4583